MLNKNLPKIAFGTYNLTGESGIGLISTALSTGFRLIDTADHYKTHTEIAKAIKKSNLKRDEILICTKVWRNRLDAKSVITDIKRFLHELDTNYIDILLIHWPNKKIPIKDTLKAFKLLKDGGVIKSFGVSNFDISHLKEVLNITKEIEFNQIEIHPSLKQKELYNFCVKNNIKIMSHSSLAHGINLELNLAKTLSKNYKCTPAQIIFSYLIGKGIVPVTTGINKEMIQENFNSQNINLTEQDIQKLDEIETAQFRSLDKEYSEFES